MTDTQTTSEPTRDECERVLAAYEVGLAPAAELVAALRATLAREAAARDAALEEAAALSESAAAETRRYAAKHLDAEEKALARHEATGMLVCASRIRALKSGVRRG